MLSDQGVDQFKKLIVPVFNVGGKFEKRYNYCIEEVDNIIGEAGMIGLD